LAKTPSFGDPGAGTGRKKRLHIGFQGGLPAAALDEPVRNASKKNAGCRALWKRKPAKALYGAFASFFYPQERAGWG